MPDDWFIIFLVNTNSIDLWMFLLFAVLDLTDGMLRYTQGFRTAVLVLLLVKTNEEFVYLLLLYGSIWLLWQCYKINNET